MRITSVQIRHILFASASLVALAALPGSAVAQTSNSPKATPTDPNAQAPDSASASPSATTVAQASPAIRSGGLEEIIVTARKRTEKLQDIAASVSALSTSDLNRRFDSDVRMYTAATPPGPCWVSSITTFGDELAKSRTSE